MPMLARSRPKTSLARRKTDILPPERIEQVILLLRVEKVILDVDLAELYGVSTKALNQAVKRNKERFPIDFRFQLSKREKLEVVTVCDRLETLKYSSVRPWAFSEHGAIMAANVLNSPRAVKVSVLVVRAFAKLRLMLSKRKDIERRLHDLEREFSVTSHTHASHIARIYELIEELMAPPPAPKKSRIGFRATTDD